MKKVIFDVSCNFNRRVEIPAPETADAVNILLKKDWGELFKGSYANSSECSYFNYRIVDVLNVQPDERSLEMESKNDYFPKPVDTSDVVLPPEVEELGEQAAENGHEWWALLKFIKYIKDNPELYTGTKEEYDLISSYKEGDPIPPKEMLLKMKGKPDHPDFISYKLLTEDKKDYDRVTAFALLRFLLKKGWKLVPQIKYTDYLLFFDLEKLIAATAYILAKEKVMTVSRLQNLVYMAERRAITRRGLPLTGCEIRKGETPYLLQLKNFLLGRDSQNYRWDRYFCYDPVSYNVMARSSHVEGFLTEEDKELLDSAYLDFRSHDLDHCLRSYPEMKVDGKTISTIDLIKLAPIDVNIADLMRVYKEKVALLSAKKMAEDSEEE